MNEVQQVSGQLESFSYLIVTYMEEDDIIITNESATKLASSLIELLPSDTFTLKFHEEDIINYLLEAFYLSDLHDSEDDSENIINFANSITDDNTIILEIVSTFFES